MWRNWRTTLCTICLASCRLASSAACQGTYAVRAAERGARAAGPGAHAVGDAAAVQRGQAGERAGRVEARGRLAQAALLLQKPEQLAACESENRAQSIQSQNAQPRHRAARWGPSCCLAHACMVACLQRLAPRRPEFSLRGQSGRAGASPLHAPRAPCAGPQTARPSGPGHAPYPNPRSACGAPGTHSMSRYRRCASWKEAARRAQKGEFTAASSRRSAAACSICLASTSAALGSTCAGTVYALFERCVSMRGVQLSLPPCLASTAPELEHMCTHVRVFTWGEQCEHVAARAVQRDAHDAELPRPDHAQHLQVLEADALAPAAAQGQRASGREWG